MCEAVYDFAIDDGVRIRRVQVKSSGSFDSRGKVRFYLRRRNNEGYRTREVDLFALYNAVTDEVRVCSAEDLSGKMSVSWEDENA